MQLNKPKLLIRSHLAPFSFSKKKKIDRFRSEVGFDFLAFVENKLFLTFNIFVF